jgi:hypothetical protein
MKGVRVIQMRLDQKLSDKLDSWEAETGLNRSSLIRALIEAAAVPPTQLYPQAAERILESQRYWSSRAGEGTGPKKKKKVVEG